MLPKFFILILIIDINIRIRMPNSLDFCKGGLNYRLETQRQHGNIIPLI